MKISKLSAELLAKIPDSILKAWSDRIVLTESRGADFDSRNSILLVDQNDISEVLREYTSYNACHIVQKEHPFLVDEISTSATMIENLDIFLKEPQKTVLNGKGNRSFTRSFFSSREKGNVLDAIESYLEAGSHTTYVKQAALVIADELFTNAIYNAPVAQSDKKIQRGIHYQLDSGKKCHLFLSESDERLVIGCEDPFGLLEISRFIHRVLEVQVGGAGIVMNRGKGGAGIGCHMMFDLSSEVYLAVHQGQKTVVCFSLLHKLGNRKRQLIPKNIHVGLME